MQPVATAREIRNTALTKCFLITRFLYPTLGYTGFKEIESIVPVAGLDEGSQVPIGIDFVDIKIRTDTRWATRH